MKSVQYTASDMLSCARCGGEVIVCLDHNLVANDMPFIEATITSVTRTTSNCGIANFLYSISYDENLLTNPADPLVTGDIRGIFCKGCLTDYIEALGTPSMQYILDLLQPYFDKVCLATTEAEFVAAIGNADCHHIIVGDQFTLTASRTVPPGKCLTILQDCFITTGGHILTIQCPFHSGNYICFAYNTASDVIFDDASVYEVHPAWFGANGDDAGNDTLAIQAAINSISLAGRLGRVRFPAGTFIISWTLSIPAGVTLEGSGQEVTILKWTPVTGSALQLTPDLSGNNDGSAIRDLKILADPGSDGTAVWADNLDFIHNFEMRNFMIEGFLRGVWLEHANHISISEGKLLGQGDTVAGGYGVRMGNDGSGVQVADGIYKGLWIRSYETGIRTFGEAHHVTGCLINDTDIACTAGHRRMLVSSCQLQAATYLYRTADNLVSIIAINCYHQDGVGTEVDDVATMADLAVANKLSIYDGVDWKGDGLYRFRFAVSASRALQFGVSPDEVLVHTEVGSLMHTSTAHSGVSSNNIVAAGTVQGAYRIYRSGNLLGYIGFDAQEQPALIDSTRTHCPGTWNDDEDFCAGGGTIATDATNGFLWIPQCAGTPTGVPAGVANMANSVPLVVDSTNHKLYFYSGGSWRDAGP